ncbi:MAG TPA: hypothetical protein VHF26_04105 [Trebonia sp.]|nr:hypothetical protein [Trebonia sp.]
MTNSLPVLPGLCDTSSTAGTQPGQDPGQPLGGGACPGMPWEPKQWFRAVADFYGDRWHRRL